MKKSKNKVYRWIAMMLTAALLVGQCQMPVLANEGTAPVETGVSGENKDGAQEGGSGAADKDAPNDGEDGTDNGDGEGGAGNGGTGEAGDGADNSGTEEGGGDTGNGGTGEAGTGSDNGDGEGSSGETGSGNGGAEDDGEDNPGAGDSGTGDEGENQGGEEGTPDKCVCETACTEDAVNMDCPVCAADYVACAKNAGEEESVSGNDLDGKAGAVLPTEENGIETHVAIDGRIEVADSILWYYVLDEDAGEAGVRVANPDKASLTEDLIIPGTVVDTDGVEWQVTTIGYRGFNDCGNLKSVKISEGVKTIEGHAFFNCVNLKVLDIAESVIRIDDSAFTQCMELEEVELPGGVTEISNVVFQYCYKLKTVKLPDHISRIGDQAFMDCWVLENIELPDSVTSLGKRAFSGCKSIEHVNIKNVTQIGDLAFASCERLNGISLPTQLMSMGEAAFVGCKSWTMDADGKSNIVIPASLDKICPRVFERCVGLTEITVSDSIAMIDENAFKDCEKLQTMHIAISDASNSIPVKNANAFEGCPSPRQAVLMDADGTAELTGYTSIRAKLTYLGAPDEDTADDMWYGWTIDRPDIYTVTINVKKDNTPWSNHGRTFALLSDSGFLEATGQTGDSSYTISQVPDGTYRIYDITGVSADSLYSRARDTGAEVRVNGADTELDVTVNGADVEKDVHYYTATFYDGTEAYKAGTPQEPQIILRGKKAAKPEDPQKADWQFAGWKTTDGGSTPYDFDTPVTDITSIFASWVEKTAEQLHITADAAEGGTIDPTGDIVVTKGGEQSFTITPNEGYKIKIVTVDGKDVTAGLKDTLARAQAGARYYTFTNVTEDHTIHAAFEADSGDKPGEGDDNPGDDDKPGDDDNPGDDDKPGDDDNPGGDDKPDDGDDKPDDGGDKPGGGGDKPDPGDDTPDGGGDNPAPDGDTPGGETGTAQVTVVSQTSSPQSLDGAGSSEGAPDISAAGRTANGKEPKTGDADYVEIYATLAMIAGLTYLLLYFMEESRGMTEREKEVFVAAFIRWAKKGGRFRRCCAVAAIFCLLVYYHSIGKRAGRAGFDRECLRQAL